MLGMYGASALLRGASLLFGEGSDKRDNLERYVCSKVNHRGVTIRTGKYTLYSCVVAVLAWELP